MASTLGSTFWEGRGRSSTPPLGAVGIISSATPFNEGPSLKNIIQDFEVDGGGDFIQREVSSTSTWGEEKPKAGAI